ncbi:hypothetical protein GDO81_023203 [Engystomops pustulosus]|uniref:C3H1-type domain-containing protein n=1 Tax=Engystomops pustulosus TaxID=76066 RepID=A0AAV6YML2_ENGPU|nr:hypothetical protein GDO81_023203 [Engystomops pustulosus]
MRIFVNALNPEIGWGVKAADVWLRLMVSPKPPFQAAATSTSASSAAAGVAVRRPGACWLFNEGHCKFFGLCKYKHECSSCGGSHAALRCTRPAVKSGRTNTHAQEQKDPGERSRDGALARQVPQ